MGVFFCKLLCVKDTHSSKRTTGRTKLNTWNERIRESAKSIFRITQQHRTPVVKIQHYAFREWGRMYSRENARFSVKSRTNAGASEPHLNTSRLESSTGMSFLSEHCIIPCFPFKGGMLTRQDLFLMQWHPQNAWNCAVIQKYLQSSINTLAFCPYTYLSSLILWRSRKRLSMSFFGC